MTVLLTAALILLVITACGATIAAGVLLAERFGRRRSAANLIIGAEALLRTAACS